MSLLPYASLTHRRRAYRSTGDVVLLNAVTITSATAAAEFTGIDSTYGEYIFGFYNVNPATDSQTLAFQMDTDGGNDGYNDANITNTMFRGFHYENDSTAQLGVNTVFDQYQSTAFSNLGENVGGDADEHISGMLHVFNPASTTYVKNFYSRAVELSNSAGAFDFFTAGYFNTTSALNALKFKFQSGNIDAGIFKMWGVK